MTFDAAFVATVIAAETAVREARENESAMPAALAARWAVWDAWAASLPAMTEDGISDLIYEAAERTDLAPEFVRALGRHGKEAALCRLYPERVLIRTPDGQRTLRAQGPL